MAEQIRPALSNRLKRVQVAATVQMTIKARELRAKGVDVIQLTKIGRASCRERVCYAV